MKRSIVIVGLAAMLLAATILPAAAAPLHAEPVTYRVKWGDVMWRIAAYYGTTTWSIANLNGISNPDRIIAGQLLLIHPGTNSSPTYTYYVKWGDTLADIARRFGTDAWTVARMNGLHNLDLIYVGQALIIP